MRAIYLQTNYLTDPIHPNRAGYETWWGPKIDEKLTELFAE